MSDAVTKSYQHLTEDEMKQLWIKLCDAAIDWADNNNIGGLSGLNNWDLYTALHEAVFFYSHSSSQRQETWVEEAADSTPIGSSN